MKQFLKMNKQTIRENTLISLIFIMSICNKWTLFLAILLSLILLKRGVIGVIQLIYLYMIRTLMNSTFDLGESTVFITYMQYILIYVIGIFFLIRYIKKWTRSYIMFNFAFSSMNLMLIYILISLVVSDYPMMSVIKIINYFIPLTIIVLLICLIKDIEELVIWTAQQVKLLIIFSLLPIVLKPTNYFIKGESFHGFLSDYKTFAVVLLMGLLILILYILREYEINLLNLFVVLIAIIELYLTDSKLAWVTLMISLLIILLLLNLKKRYKYPMILGILMLAITSIFHPLVHSLVVNFIFKGNSIENVLMPKDNQIKNIQYAFETHPFLGSGFGIPMHHANGYLKNLNIEAGNIIFEVIIFTGMIGLTCYVIYILKVILLARKPFRVTIVLFIATLLVNCIEIIMFKSLNAGALCYILWGIYLKDGIQDEKYNFKTI